MNICVITGPKAVLSGLCCTAHQIVDSLAAGFARALGAGTVLRLYSPL